jgi:hypothetical protein
MPFIISVLITLFNPITFSLFSLYLHYKQDSFIEKMITFEATINTKTEQHES